MVVMDLSFILKSPQGEAVLLNPNSETELGGTGNLPVPPGHWSGGMGGRPR